MTNNKAITPESMRETGGIKRGMSRVGEANYR
jgi:hypothetical protein